MPALSKRSFKFFVGVLFLTLLIVTSLLLYFYYSEGDTRQVGDSLDYNYQSEVEDKTLSIQFLSDIEGKTKVTVDTDELISYLKQRGVFERITTAGLMDLGGDGAKVPDRIVILLTDKEQTYLSQFVEDEGSRIKINSYDGYFEGGVYTLKIHLSDYIFETGQIYLPTAYLIFGLDMASSHEVGSGGLVSKLNEITNDVVGNKRQFVRFGLQGFRLNLVDEVSAQTCGGGGRGCRLLQTHLECSSTGESCSEAGSSCGPGNFGTCESVEECEGFQAKNCEEQFDGSCDADPCGPTSCGQDYAGCEWYWSTNTPTPTPAPPAGEMYCGDCKNNSCKSGDSAYCSSVGDTDGDGQCENCGDDNDPTPPPATGTLLGRVFIDLNEDGVANDLSTGGYYTGVQRSSDNTSTYYCGDYITQSGISITYDNGTNSGSQNVNEKSDGTGGCGPEPYYAKSIPVGSNYTVRVQGLPSNWEVISYTTPNSRCTADPGNNRIVCDIEDGLDSHAWFGIRINEPPTCSIFGTTVQRAGDIAEYTTLASDPNDDLDYSDSFESPTDTSSFTMIGDDGESYTSTYSCPSGTGGQHYIVCNAYDQAGYKCSGNPFCEYPPNPPNLYNCSDNWADCGNYDNLVLTCLYCDMSTSPSGTVTLFEGGTLNLEAIPSFQPSDYSADSVRFYSSDSAIASVNPSSDSTSTYNTTITANSSGDAVITASANSNGLNNLCSATVDVHVGDCTINVGADLLNQDINDSVNKDINVSLEGGSVPADEVRVDCVGGSSATSPASQLSNTSYRTTVSTASTYNDTTTCTASVYQAGNQISCSGDDQFDVTTGSPTCPINISPDPIYPYLQNSSTATVEDVEAAPNWALCDTAGGTLDRMDFTVADSTCASPSILSDTSFPYLTDISAFLSPPNPGCTTTLTAELYVQESSNPIGSNTATIEVLTPSCSLSMPGSVTTEVGTPYYLNASPTDPRHCNGALTYCSPIISEANMDRVEFTSDPTQISLSDPIDDDGAPFDTEATVLQVGGPFNVDGAGYVNVYSGTAYLGCTDTTQFSGTNPDAWYQLIDGGAQAATSNIDVDMPLSCALDPICQDMFIAGENPGVADCDPASGSPCYGNFDNTSTSIYDYVSESGYRGVDDFDDANYDFEYFYRKVQGSTEITPVISNLIDYPAFEAGTPFTASPSGFTVHYYDGSLGDFTLTNTGGHELGSSGQKKVVLLVDNANLIIDDKLTQADNSFFMVVVEGDITIADTVGDTAVPSGDLEADPSLADIEGIYFAEGSFITQTNGTGDLQIYVYGSVAANGYALNRELSDNSYIPAEVFNFNPTNMILYPRFLSNVGYSWEEVAP